MKGDIGAIFWKLHTAFLKNNRERADFMLGLLEHEADEPELRRCLGDIHFERFSKIKENMIFGNYGRLHGGGYGTPVQISTSKPESDVKEAQFHLLLMSDRTTLMNRIGCSPKCNIVHELDMGPYGRCDMLIRDGRTWHVVEVKMGDATSSVVSQVDKYRVNLELQMCLGLHDEVKAHVVARAFPPYVASELSRLSVSMISHDGTAESLKAVS